MSMFSNQQQMSKRIIDMERNTSSSSDIIISYFFLKMLIVLLSCLFEQSEVDACFPLGINHRRFAHAQRMSTFDLYLSCLSLHSLLRD